MTKNLRRIEPTEHQIQSAIVEWAHNLKLTSKIIIGDYLFAIPNGGNRSLTEGLRLKKEGVKKGVSDLFLAYPVSFNWGEDWKHGLFIEVKTKKGKVSVFQSEWINLMKENRYEAVVVRSLDEGIQAIKDYFRI